MTPTTEAVSNDEAALGRPQRAPLGVLANTEGLNTFRSLPIEERERILEEFRSVSALDLSNTTFDEYMAYFPFLTRGRQ